MGGVLAQGWPTADRPNWLSKASELGAGSVPAPLNIPVPFIQLGVRNPTGQISLQELHQSQVGICSEECRTCRHCLKVTRPRARSHGPCPLLGTIGCSHEIPKEKLCLETALHHQHSPSVPYAPSHNEKAA